MTKWDAGSVGEQKRVNPAIVSIVRMHTVRKKRRKANDLQNV